PGYLQSIRSPPQRDNQLPAPDPSLKKAKSSPIPYLLWNYIKRTRCRGSRIAHDAQRTKMYSNLSLLSTYFFIFILFLFYIILPFIVL
ncbi:MAG: hypothetical protein IJU47_03640, partial [Verrucomicrobia bacterium]|nr:hypothetical protein [Verrucomicrobiota bacterium]